MFYYMGDVRLHGREYLGYLGILLLLAGWGGGGSDTAKITTPLCAHKKPPLDCVKVFNPPPSLYFIYTQIQLFFHKNSLFIAFIKNVCQSDIKIFNSPHW